MKLFIKTLLTWFFLFIVISIVLFLRLFGKYGDDLSEKFMDFVDYVAMYLEDFL